jgi:cytochrome c oxidase cbb3-type subunit 3
MKRYIISLSALLGAHLLSAQSQAASTPDSFIGLPVSTAILVGAILFFLLVIMTVLLTVMIDLGRYSRKKLTQDGVTDIPWIINLFGIFDGDTSSLTGIDEDIILEDHDYDGIHEYDNDLPPWWKYLFIITAIFGVVYFLNYEVYHFWGYESQTAEFEDSEKIANEKFANIDLEYEAASTEESVLTEGKEIFMTECKVCHGEFAEGGIGANLTDKNWIYGGNVNKIYATIKYGGKAGSGMQAWESNFTNEQIYSLASFIKSLPFHEGKAPQGEKE